jgi:hypothetical protein
MIDQDAVIADNWKRIAELEAEQAAMKATLERLEILTNDDKTSCRKKDNVTFRKKDNVTFVNFKENPE